MKITQRDIEILREINAFGYVDVNFIEQRFQLQKKLAYRRLKKLVDNNYLKHSRVLYGEPGVYQVTHKGAQLSEDHLPPLKRISFATYCHTLAVAHASIALIKQFGGSFLTERMLRLTKREMDAGACEHNCDGVLILNDKKIAIEVELTMKTKQRIEDIMMDYSLQSEYSEVWYLCGNEELYKHFSKLAQEYDFLKSFYLKNIINI